MLQQLMVLPDEAQQAAWARAWSLAPRLARVASGLLRGMSTREVARELGLTPAAVRAYTAEVLRCAGVSRRSELILAAIAVLEREADPSAHEKAP